MIAKTVLKNKNQENNSLWRTSPSYRLNLIHTKRNVDPKIWQADEILLINVMSAHFWSQPLHLVQVCGLQDLRTNGLPVRGERFIDEFNISDHAVLFQILVVLFEEPLWVGEGPITILFLTGVHDASTHTWRRHRCSFQASLQEF